METNFLFQKECKEIIGACYEVHNQLGPGFLESVYQESLALEFEERGIPFDQDAILNIWYKETKLEKFFVADFICHDSIIIELKALSDLTSEHYAQVLNYLKATDIEVGLLINFGSPRVQVKRFILNNKLTTDTNRLSTDSKILSTDNTDNTDD
ncbi:MAG: GxxExxY protein [Bacteroidales bacterium]|jgi:GxxExxY protein